MVGIAMVATAGMVGATAAVRQLHRRHERRLIRRSLERWVRPRRSLPLPLRGVPVSLHEYRDRTLAYPPDSLRMLVDDEPRDRLFGDVRARAA